MKTNTRTNTDGRLELVTVITFFIILFFVTIFSDKASAQVNGNSGHCRQFDGSSTSVTFSNNDMNLESGNTMTVTCWVKSINSASEGNWANLVTLNNSASNGDDGQFWLQHSQLNTVFEFAVKNNAGTRNYIQSVTNPTDGVWYHVAGVYDGSYLKIYVNGVMEAQTSMTGTINSFLSTYALNFGQWAYNGDSYRHFNGDIDEVTIWNVALTQTQIRTYMCQSLQGTESGLIGYWRMNETNSNKVYDMTSNARTGKASGGSSTIVWSGAPIGNASIYTYGGSKLSLSNPTYGDSLVVNNFSSTPTGIQIYRIDTTPNTTVPPSGYTAVANNYYYGVFLIGSTSPTYEVNYYYKSNPVVTAPSYFGLVKRNDNSVLTWTDVAATLNTMIYAFQKTGQSGRNEYVLALTRGGLPIKLASFNAQPEGNQVDINWVTATEVDNKYFTVERTTDGINYDAIAIVNGAGNSDHDISYSAVDPNPLEGTAYYRLRQTDFDGNTQVFPIVAVTFSGFENVNSYNLANVYPNPFRNNLTLNIESAKSQQLTINIMNGNGMEVDTYTINCSTGSNTFEYGKANMLAGGIYFICITDANGLKTVQKIVKQ
jgi:hypothetical protein